MGTRSNEVFDIHRHVPETGLAAPRDCYPSGTAIPTTYHEHVELAVSGTTHCHLCARRDPHV
jgi:hypothetical protein